MLPITPLFIDGPLLVPLLALLFMGIPLFCDDGGDEATEGSDSDADSDFSETEAAENGTGAAFGSTEGTGTPAETPTETPTETPVTEPAPGTGGEEATGGGTEGTGTGGTQPPEETPVPGVNQVLTNEPEEFVGTEGNDTVLALGGDDQVDALGGDDLVEGNTGDDTITGGLGNDTIAGGAGTDSLLGGAGNDVIFTDRSDFEEEDFSRGEAETVDGGAGDDTIYFSRGDEITGGTGTDTFIQIAAAGDVEATVATITDFDPATETITIHHDLTPAGATAPSVTTSQDIGANTTSVLFDGEEILKIEGLVTLDDASLVVSEGLDPTAKT